MSNVNVKADNVAKKINLAELQDGKTAASVAVFTEDDLPKIMEELYAKAIAIYDEYDEIVIPACGINDIRTIITSPKEISSDATQAEIKEAAYREHLRKGIAINEIAIGMLMQSIGEERILTYEERYGNILLNTNNDVEEKIVYVFSSCDDISQMEQVISSKDISDADFMIFNQTILYDGGEKIISYAYLPDVQTQTEKLRAEYEAALAAEKGEVK